MAGHAVRCRTACQTNCADRVRPKDVEVIRDKIPYPCLSPPSATPIPVNLVDRRELSNVPAATQSFHQENAGSHAAREQIYCGSLICQRHALRCDDGQIVVETAFIALHSLIA